MAIVKLKPTSPGRRAVVRVTNPDLFKGRPFDALIEPQSKTAGRNNNGRITTRHRGGGHKQHYRIIDFRRNKDGIAAKVERIEYDPNRSAHIALLCYADGERRYIPTLRYACVQVKFAGFILSAARRLVKSVTRSTTCASLVRPARFVGGASARLYEALR